VTDTLRQALLVFVAAFVVRGAVAAAPEFDLPGTLQYGATQREFIEALLGAKTDPPNQSVKSLVTSHDGIASVSERPPMDLGITARDARLASEAWLRYGEALYAGGQYAAAAQALEKVDDAYRQANAETVTPLLAKLAMRGFRKTPVLTMTGAATPDGELRLVLLQMRSTSPQAVASRLRAIAAGPPTEHRDRAIIWGALLAAEQGNAADALASLGKVDGASRLAVDAMLAWLRVKKDASPEQVSAIARLILAASGPSPAAWEAQDRLLQSLRAQGAIADSAERSLDAVTTINAFLDTLQREIQRLQEAPVPALVDSVGKLPDERRYRVEALLRQKPALLAMAQQTAAWRPFMAGYQERLQRDRLRFADELSAEIERNRNRTKQDAAGLNTLFHLELSKLIGRPPDAATAYRIFFGVTQWELGYEYPDTWRPESGKVLKGDERRKKREEARKRERDDKKYLPLTIGHAKKLGEKFQQRLAKVPKLTYEGMAEEAGDMIAAGVRIEKEVAAMLPMIDEAIRREFIGAVGDRKRVAQQWLVRFAAQALSDNAQLGGRGEQAHFSLDKTLAPRAGEPVLRSIEAIQTLPGRRTAEELKLTGVRDALQPLSREGETREVRADAHRLRAQLTVALYEAQQIASAVEAIDHYATLLKDYGDLVDVADTTYQLARAEDLSARLEQSLATLETFVRRFPADSRVGEASFRIAETQFALSEYGKAKSGYESVIRGGDRRYLDQAEYKLAWTDFKLGDFRAALPRFVSVIDRGYGAQQVDDVTRRNRMQDAFRALSLTFSNLEGPAEVERYFSGKGRRPYVGSVYHGLARHYLERKRVADAARTYDYLHRHEPMHEKAPDLLGAVVVAARQEKLNKLALEQQEVYVDRYAMSGAYWAQASEPVRAEIGRNLRPFLGDLAQMYHADAQQQKRRESYVKAIRFYDQYVTGYPADPKTPEFHFLLAEARFETGDVQRAMQDYEKVAYDYGRHPKAAEAGYALLIATQKAVGELKNADERKAGLRQLVVRSSRFSTAFPEDNRVEAVLVKAGEDILMLGDAAEAVRLGEALLARKPSEQVGRRAQLVSAHGYFESGAFAKAEGAYLAVLAVKGRPPAEEKELRDRLGLSVYRQAEAARQAGQASAAIDTFLRVGKTAPGSESVPNAEIDAAALLLSSKRWAEGIDVLERFQRSYPGHRLGEDIPVRLAFAYENDGRFLKAADMLESLSQSEKDDALARQMHWRSAELREKGGRMDLAVTTFERYLVRYPQPLEKATEVRQSLADIATKNRDLVTRDRWLNEIIANAPAGSSQESARVRFLAAQASVTLGDVANADFAKVQLKLPLDKSLGEKRKSMEVALGWYALAGRYAVAEVTTAATYKTAEIYRVLAKDVMASERPSGLTALEKSQYDILLEEQATPFEEKATEFHEVNYQRIPKGSYDRWVKRSIVSLRSLQPGQYDKVEAAVDYFEYVPPKPAPPPDSQVGKAAVTPGPAAPPRIELKPADARPKGGANATGSQ
jgi:cellulose synthase operon protein C